MDSEMKCEELDFLMWRVYYVAAVICDEMLKINVTNQKLIVLKLMANLLELMKPTLVSILATVASCLPVWLMLMTLLMQLPRRHDIQRKWSTVVQTRCLHVVTGSVSVRHWCATARPTVWMDLTKALAATSSLHRLVLLLLSR